MKNKQNKLIGMATTLLMLQLASNTVSGQALNKGSSHKFPAGSEAVNQDEDVRIVLMELSAAANDGDGEKFASVWNADAIFIDESGEEFRGRAAIKDRFVTAFKQRAASTIGIHPEKISLPAPNVANVVGTVSRKNGELLLPASRFSLVLVKENGVWSITQAAENSIQELKAADHLKELEWMVGNWQVERTGGGPKLEVEWVPGRNFIVSKCLHNKGGALEVDQQVIGWDPRSNCIVSWHFDCNGGFGYGKWTKDTDGWTVDFKGVGANGANNGAANVFKIVNPDEVTWKSTQQNSDGVAIADTEIVKIKKIKP